MTTKKLYKIKTQSILYEVFEVEAESYEKALDLMLPTIYDGTESSMRTCNIICKIVHLEYEGHGSQDYKKAA